MPKINQSFINETVRRATLIAYNEDTRLLDFSAQFPVSRDVAIKIMLEACPSYNEFVPAFLAKLPADAKVILAREGSVCVYVEGDLTHLEGKLKADECHYYNEYKRSNVTRFWWD